MQLTENTHKIKRKDEKRDQFCAWEDTGVNDDEFHCYLKAKQKHLPKCSYLDERNIILSSTLFVQPRSNVPGPNEASDRTNTRWKASQLKSVPAKPSANPEVNLSRSALDHSVPINNSVSTDSMTQKQNIVHSKNSTAVHFVGLSEALPMIEWIPASSHAHSSEEMTERCTESISANHETRSPQTVWKGASGQRQEWCHGCPAKVAHLGLSLAANDLYAARPRVVIRRVARVSGGFRAAVVQGSQVEDKLCPLCPYRLPGNHRTLQNACYSLSTSGAQNHNQAVYECLCSSVQPRVRHSPGGDQRDATQIFNKIEQEQKSSEMISVMDIQCQSGWLRSAEIPLSPHHVTFSHILQVLQSKPANFPEVRGYRRHRAL